MSMRSKSVLDVAKTALKTAQDAMPAYRSPKSKHVFTQHQLFAILVLRRFLDLDYRGIEIVLREWSDLREVLKLTSVPNYSTLCLAQARLISQQTLMRSCLPQ